MVWTHLVASDPHESYQLTKNSMSELYSTLPVMFLLNELPKTINLMFYIKRYERLRLVFTSDGARA